MKTIRFFSAFAHSSLLLAPVVCNAAAEIKPLEQWPAWRGPLATGVAPLADPPTVWSETKNVKWKVAVPGSGTATPIVWGDRVFLLTAIPSGKEVGPTAPAGGGGRGGRGGSPTQSFLFAVLSLDRETGKTVWQKTATEQVPHEGHHQTHGFASGSPVTDGTMLYAYFGSRGLYAMDFDGDIKWSVDFGDQQTRNGFGEGTSPALAGNTILVNWDHEGPDDFIVALDKTTGKELWRKSREEKTSWATPYVLEHDGGVEAVVNATGSVRSYNVKNGDLIWESAGQTDNAIPSVVSGHGLFIVMSGFRGSALQAIKVGSKGKVMGTDAIAWSYNRGTPYVPSPLIYGDRLYFFSGNSARLSILDAKTGERHVEAERVGDMTDVYAAPVGAAGRVYLAGRDGRFAVVKQVTKLEILAQNRLDDSFDAGPVPVGKELFLRGHRSLYCIVED